MMIIKAGTGIKEMFITDFLQEVKSNMRFSKEVRYEINSKSNLNNVVYCPFCYASQYIAFTDCAKNEVVMHGIAIVKAEYYSEDETDEKIIVIVEE